MAQFSLDLASIQRLIDEQKGVERSLGRGKIRPIESPVNPESHTPVYKMHRYYARRPWNVFQHLIKEYTEPGEIILDPFCGGGVSVLEGLALRRRVVGVDYNPLAWFVTSQEITPVDLKTLDVAFQKVEGLVKEEIHRLYSNSSERQISWIEWTNVFQCPACKQKVRAIDSGTDKKGIYQCPNKKCKSQFRPWESNRLQAEPLYVCEQAKIIRKAERTDLLLYENAVQLLTHFEKRSPEIIPDDTFPQGDRWRDDALEEKGIEKYRDFFTIRNLLATALLKKAVLEVETSQDIKQTLWFLFSGSLRFSNKFVFRVETWQSGKPIEWAGHAFWLPEVFCELNVWESFANRLAALKKGVNFQAKRDLGFTQFANDFSELKNRTTALLLCRSAHSLPEIPNNSVDAVITDPPFGGNVQYLELSNFFLVWLKEGGLKAIFDNKFEAIQTRHQGFETAKDANHYEEMLFKIFKECRRALKKNGWMVMTFHNRDLQVWMALHRAVRRAGFRLPTADESRTRGMVYQPPIEEYTTTFHQRAKGSMLGDFILSFKKAEDVVEVDSVLLGLTTEQESGIVERISSFIAYQGGADETAIMTCLIPYLSEAGLLHRLSQFNWGDLLSGHFIYDKKTGKWFNHDMVAESTKTLKLKPVNFIPAEQMVEQLIISHLKEKKIASLDELLNTIYTQLVNSHRPGVEAIQGAIKRVCQIADHKSAGGKKKRILYALKSSSKRTKTSQEEPTFLQESLQMEGAERKISSHDGIIALLADWGESFGLQVHIGKTEQRKNKPFKEISTPMNNPGDWGFSSKSAFRIIKEIDLLYLKDRNILAGFEIATTIDTAREAINERFRELFVSIPNLSIRCFVIVKDKDTTRAHQILWTQSNLQGGISEKIKLLKLSELGKDLIGQMIGHINP